MVFGRGWTQGLLTFLETGSYHLPSCVFARGPYPRKD